MALTPDAMRLKAVIDGDVPDRVPNFEFFFDNPAVVEHFLGRPTESFDDWVTFCDRIGWGAVGCGFFGFGIGARHETASDGTSHYAGGSPLTRQTLEQAPEPDFGPAVEQYIDKARLARERGLLVYHFVLHCFHSAATNIGMQNVALMSYDDPELLLDYMQRVESINRVVLRMTLESAYPPDFVVFDADCAFKNASMVSPAHYRRFTFEATDDTCALLRGAGVPILFHSDGKMDDIYPVWLEWGCVGTHGVEKQANDLGEMKARFGDRLTLFGNMDPVFLAWATPGEVAAETERMVASAMQGGRYGAAVNTIVSDYTPLANYLAMLEAVDKVGWYR